MRSARRSGSLFPKWDAANQERADRANARYWEQAEMFRKVDTTEGIRIVWALPVGEPLNDYGELGILLIPFVLLWTRFVGRGDYNVVICRKTRSLRNRAIYRSERLTKKQAKELVADLVALAEAGLHDAGGTAARA